ncbi:MAG: hypothetical protein K0Q97_497 [Bacillota bacterium]|nr:hypothetical protein [Bacillota bacterium]
MEFNKNKIDFYQISLNIERRYYKFIGMGSGRIVYDLENGYVVKVAKNKKGIAQNKTEYKISLLDNTNLFAKVLDVSENFEYLIMEKAIKINDIYYVWKYFNVRSNKQLYRVKELQNISYRYGLLLIDLRRPVNWGLLNGRPVIIDYGYTEEVRRRYYMHR